MAHKSFSVGEQEVQRGTFPTEEGSDRAALVGTWHPARVNPPQPDCHDFSNIMESGSYISQFPQDSGMQLKPFLLFFASLATFSSSHTLAVLTPSLDNRAMSLYSSQDTCPCFHCLLTSRSRLSHAGLLPSFADFLHLGIKSSCTLWKASLKICQLCSAPLSLRAGPDFTHRLTHTPQNCVLHQCMITAAQAASNLDVTG
ncbi:hypothetical protein QYF61_004301 [Mycteria americana]|uniref:Uncharacterized protein n=1 Tax=Mycteria americana TaxID=33587 RepID=A0AAN7SGW3_MYCAM|nr:hypothetical protein QYF61_004301 [Mycteria americana]